GITILLPLDFTNFHPGYHGRESRTATHVGPLTVTSLTVTLMPAGWSSTDTVSPAAAEVGVAVDFAVFAVGAGVGVALSPVALAEVEDSPVVLAVVPAMAPERSRAISHPPPIMTTRATRPAIIQFVVVFVPSITPCLFKYSCAPANT